MIEALGMLIGSGRWRWTLNGHRSTFRAAVGRGADVVAALLAEAGTILFSALNIAMKLNEWEKAGGRDDDPEGNRDDVSALIEHISSSPGKAREMVRFYVNDP